MVVWTPVTKAAMLLYMDERNMAVPNAALSCLIMMQAEVQQQKQANPIWMLGMNPQRHLNSGPFYFFDQL